MRRSSGEGTVYRRSCDGRWTAMLSITVNGKRTRKVVYGKTRKEATQKLEALKAQYGTGLNVVGASMTLQQFLRSWLETIVAIKNKDTTLATYRYHCEYYLIPHLGTIRLDRLEPHHVQQMIAQLCAAGTPSARTIRQIVSTLHTALQVARRWDYVRRNVAELVEVPSVAPRQTVPLTPAQAGTLLDVAEQHRNAGAYWLALGLGLRIGEILTLHWADVDLEVGTLTVQDSKTPAGQATLVIPALVVAALKRHRTRQRRDQLKAVHWAEHDLVVCRQDGKPLGDAALRSQFKDHAQRAGLPPTTRFHDMRHSCAAFLIAKHVHQRVIMQVLRHSDIAITMNVYGHVLPEAQQEAAEAMNEVLAQVFRTGPAVDEENP